MITKEEALTRTLVGEVKTIYKAIAEIDHKILVASHEGYNGLVDDFHTRKLTKRERNTIRTYYMILGYTKVKVGKRSIDIEWR